MIFLITTSKLKGIVNTAKRLGFDDGRADGYGAGHTRGYKEGFETGRLYERSPELFGMNYFDYLRETGQLTERYTDGVADRLERIEGGFFLSPQPDIPRAFKEAFDE